MSDSNMKQAVNDVEDDLRPEYDLTSLLNGAVRGKYVERYRQGTNLVLLEPDIAAAFPSPETVNRALRLVMQLSAIPATKVRRKQEETISTAGSR
jgi:hypothetical protein